jgi:hypothetical protein
MLYRSHWMPGLFVLLIAAPILLFGMSGIWAAFGQGWDGMLFAWFVTAFGALGFYAGLDIVYRHFVVEDDGLIRKAALGTERIRIGWDDIHSWLVYPSDDSGSSSAAWKLLYPDATPFLRWTIENRGILIRAQSRRSPLYIADWEVAIPSFDAFLDELRIAVADREVRIPGKASSTEATGSSAAPADSLDDAIQAPSASH